MNAFRKMCIACSAVAAAGLLCPVFAQDMEKQTVPDSGLRRAADIVNLLRGVFAPDPAPVLASPAERAVSIRQAGASADSNSRPSVVTTIPVVTMPDIVIPDSDAAPNDVPDTAVAKTVPDDTVKKADEQKNVSDDDDADDDTHPSFYYAFFFGEYVPYYNGWFYYSDRWLWGRRLPRPPEPPDWIPPPPPPFLPVYPGHYDFYEMIGPNGSVSISTGRSGIFSPSRMLETVRPNAPGNTIPVVPGAHRIPRRRDR